MASATLRRSTRPRCAALPVLATTPTAGARSGFRNLRVGAPTLASVGTGLAACLDYGLRGRGPRSFPRTLEHYWNKWILGERLGGETRSNSTGFAEGTMVPRAGIEPARPKRSQDFKSLSSHSPIVRFPVTSCVSIRIERQEKHEECAQTRGTPSS